MAADSLQLFRDIAQQRSVSRGARTNGISQSAASQQLNELEKNLEIALLDRSTRPLSLTDAGKLYLDYCRDMLRRRDQFNAELDRLKKEQAGTVRVAAIYSVGLSEMSQIEARFAFLFPKAELLVDYLRPEKVFEAVKDDRADLGLLSYAESTREIVALPWREEEMVVAMSPHHALASQREIDPKELENQSFVGFDEDLPIWSEIDRYLREHEVEVDVVLHFDNLHMIKEAVVHGSGVSILPLRVMQSDIAEKRLIARKLKTNDLFRPVRIIHRRRKVFSDVATGLLSLLRDDVPALIAV